MERKDFLSQSFLAGGALLTGSSRFNPAAPAGPFHLNYGIHDGMFKNSAGPSFTDHIHFAYEQGYKGVLGMEHGMAGIGVEGEKALIKAYRDADDFL